MMEFFSRKIGYRYPWPKYAQATVADFIGGMENVSATTLVDRFFMISSLLVTFGPQPTHPRPATLP